MQLKDVLTSRYSTKVFDESKKIAPEIMDSLLATLQLSASSTNLQPWHFIIASTDEGKVRIAKATEGYEYNSQKVLKASHVVLFCGRTEIDEQHLQNVLNAEEQAGRFANEQAKEMTDSTRKSYLELHRKRQDVPEWLARQVYLNLGSFLLAAGYQGVDAVALEGLDFDVLNAEFDLPKQGLNALVAVALGYHSDDDFNAKLPKARLAQEKIFTHI